MKYTFNKEEHIHFMDDKPLLGTSTIMSVLAKPLTWWASGLAVGTMGWVKATDWKELKAKAVQNAADMGISYDEAEKIIYSLENQRRIMSCEPVLENIKRMTPDEYIALLDKAYRAHADNLKQTAGEGTDLHAEAEKWVNEMIKIQDEGKDWKTEEVSFHPRLLPFVLWAREHVKRFIYSEAHCYSKVLWVGGISDCGAELMTGKYAIIDFKSSKEAYLSQAFQIAGYDIEIEENGLFSADGELFLKLDKPISQYIVVPFGAKNCVPKVFKDVATMREAFRACTILYKIMNFN